MLSIKYKQCYLSLSFFAIILSSQNLFSRYDQMLNKEKINVLDNKDHNKNEYTLKQDESSEGEESENYKQTQVKSVYSNSYIPQLCSDLICANKLQVTQQFQTDEINTPTICADTGTIKSLCVNESLYLNNGADYCSNYKATLTFSADSIYNLGSSIDFNDILDDPNGNISISPTTYTAPRSGYYLVTLQVDQDSLVTSGPVLGTPISNPQILVNGTIYREAFFPYLSFFNSQHTTFSTLVTLAAGDQLTSTYNIIVLDQIVGVQSLVGTVRLLADGTQANKTMLQIHYLSGMCDVFPCDTTCVPQMVDCNTCQCAPCLRYGDKP